jgi:transposase
MPQEFGAWSTVHNRFRQWRDAGVFEALLEGLITEAAQAANRKKKGSGGGRPVSHDTGLYKERNTVERLINKLKAWRGIATRYDKTPDSYLAGLHLRASMIWLKELTRTTH